MSAAHELPVLCTIDDAAEALSLHPDHVRRLVRAGELVGYRLGRAVRVEVDSVRAYVARCRLAPTAPSNDREPTSTGRTSSAAPAARTGTPAAGASRKTASRPTRPSPAQSARGRPPERARGASCRCGGTGGDARRSRPMDGSGSLSGRIAAAIAGPWGAGRLRASDSTAARSMPRGYHAHRVSDPAVSRV